MSSKKHGWTKTAWLAYKAKAERYLYMVLRSGYIENVVRTMDDRED